MLVLNYPYRDIIPCLEILDIVLEIFERVSDKGRGNPDLASLARTCRAFSDLALSILWRTQSSLLPLVLCFPRDIIDVDGEYEGRQGGDKVLKFAKLPSVQDWERPLFYAKYIKILGGRLFLPPSTASVFYLHPSVASTLADSCPTLPFLPNLQELEYLSLFDQETGYDTLGIATYLALMFKVSSPTNLRSLSLIFPGGISDDDARSWRSRFTEYFKAIESLEIVTHSPKYIECFVASASLPRLKVLRLYNRSRSSDMAILAPPSCANLVDSFSAITMILLCDFPMSWIVEVLKIVRSPGLSHVQISTGERETQVAGSDDELCAVIASRPAWRKSMRSIHITGYGSSSKALEHLMALKELRYVDLECLAVDDPILESMARAWPMLEHFGCSRTSKTVTPSLTLRSLIAFSKYCPDLTLLGLPLDASHIPSLSNVPDVSHDQDLATKSKLRFFVEILPFSHIEVPDAATLAEFLLELFPRIQVQMRCKLEIPSRVEEVWESASKIINTRLGRPSARVITQRGNIIILDD